MAAAVEGTIVWYREKFARGVVRLDTGKQFMFTQVDGVEGLEPQLRVRILDPDKGPAGCVVTGLEDGRREFAAEPVAPPPKPKLKSRKRKKRGEPGMTAGTNVLHPQWGQGFVISSTPRMARVRFAERDGEERSCRITTLKLLE